MKLQAPTAKLQRNAKQQTEAAKGGGVEYSEVKGHSLGVEEEDTTTSRHPFDLEERTAVFGEKIIRFLCPTGICARSTRGWPNTKPTRLKAGLGR